MNIAVLRHILAECRKAQSQIEQCVLMLCRQGGCFVRQMTTEMV